MSVLRLKDGKVLYRAPAHDGQKVTTMKAYPENDYLLSMGISQSDCIAFISLLRLT